MIMLFLMTNHCNASEITLLTIPNHGMATDLIQQISFFHQDLVRDVFIVLDLFIDHSARSDFYDPVADCLNEFMVM